MCVIYADFTKDLVEHKHARLTIITEWLSSPLPLTRSHAYCMSVSWPGLLTKLVPEPLLLPPYCDLTLPPACCSGTCLACLKLTLARLWLLVPDSLPLPPGCCQILLTWPCNFNPRGLPVFSQCHSEWHIVTVYWLLTINLRHLFYLFPVNSTDLFFLEHKVYILEPMYYKDSIFLPCCMWKKIYSNIRFSNVLICPSYIKR